MAEENEEVVVDKKAEKQRKKEEKKLAKQKQAEADDFEMEEETAGGKVAVFFVTLIIIIVWLAILALLIKWDVGGFGSQILAPVLKNVPYVNKILPDSALEEISTEDSAYAFDSMDEAVAKIKELEIALAEAQSGNTENAEYITQLEAQAQELQKYKEDEAAFEQEKQSFYEDVVFSDVAPDIEEYKKYYESIDPANAEVLYKQVVEQTAADEKIDEYVKTYSSMKPKEAAAIFDTMTNNLKLVAEILENMDAQSRADILGKMDSNTAAKVTEIMKPSE
jgi:flagellar motility protein MotE (MotC chaperone)